MNLKICSDVYDISNRIKYIDSGYFIVWNTSKQVYEVHSSNQIGSTYCVSIPYNTLDERTLEYVSKTQTRFSEDILNEIEKENRIQENAKISRVLLNFDSSLRGLK